MEKTKKDFSPEQFTEIAARGAPIPQEPKITQTVTKKEINAPLSVKEHAVIVQEAALRLSLESLDVYAEILRNPSPTAADKIRMMAADRILDRAVGKPQQVATVHGTSTQTSMTPQDFLEALKSSAPKNVIDVTPKDGETGH